MIEPLRQPLKVALVAGEASGVIFWCGPYVSDTRALSTG